MTAVLPWERLGSKVCDRHLARLAAVRVQHAVSTRPVSSSGSGCPAVWCPARPVSGQLGSSSGSGGPASGV
jgi:hypothetical protein